MALPEAVKSAACGAWHTVLLVEPRSSSVQAPAASPAAQELPLEPHDKELNEEARTPEGEASNLEPLSSELHVEEAAMAQNPSAWGGTAVD